MRMLKDRASQRDSYQVCVEMKDGGVEWSGLEWVIHGNWLLSMNNVDQIVCNELNSIRRRSTS